MQSADLRIKRAQADINEALGVKPQPPAQNPDIGYGRREDGSNKGRGFYGMLPRTDGQDQSSELSIGVNMGGRERTIPSMVPGLNAEQLRYLLSVQKPMRPDITQKAVDFAVQRQQQGKGPFAEPNEEGAYRVPRYAQGGSVKAKKKTPADYITDAIADGLAVLPAYKGNERKAYQKAKAVTGLLDWTPAGIPQAMYDAGEMLGRGAKDRSAMEGAGGLAMAALGGLPMARGIRKAAKSAPAVEDLLYGVHNTRADRIEKADKLGGFAVPSLAVAKVGHGFDSFGDVSLIAPKELVTPGRGNPVFASDVYSPRFPSLNDEGTKIFKGFTDQGNRRYAALTMDNIVKEMKGSVRGGEGFNYGAGSVRSAVTPQFRSLKDIQAARDRIISDADFEPLKAAANDQLLDLADRFHPYSKYSGRSFQHAQDFASMLGDYAPGGLRQMQEHYKDLPPELMGEARAYLAKLRDMPTEYFEAKPQRAVKMNEFAGALIPDNEEGAKAAEILSWNGMRNFERFTKGDAASKRAALEKFAPHFFAVPVAGAGAASLAVRPSEDEDEDEPQEYAHGGHVKPQRFAAGGGAWTRKEGKNPEGGLNAKGRASLKAQGHDIKPPVSAKLAAKSPKAAARRKSFCARMTGMPGPMKDEKGRPTRKALSLRKWDC